MLVLCTRILSATVWTGAAHLWCVLLQCHLEVGGAVLCLNTANTHVFSMEMGFGGFTNWKDILKNVPPLSPPTFTHTSSWSTIPPCQVSDVLVFTYVFPDRVRTGTHVCIYICTSGFVLGIEEQRSQEPEQRPVGLDVSILLRVVERKRKEPLQPPGYPPEWRRLLSLLTGDEHSMCFKPSAAGLASLG